MDAKRKLIDRDGESSHESSTAQIIPKKPHTTASSSTCNNVIHFLQPACIIVQNIPVSIFDDEPLNLNWLVDSLNALDIRHEKVIGVDPGYDALPYGIVDFGMGDAALMRALFLHYCFEEKSKGKVQWTFEHASQTKGIYLWAATEQDMLYVRDHVKEVEVVETPKQCLVGARQEALGSGANVYEVIKQAVQQHEEEYV